MSSNMSSERVVDLNGEVDESDNAIIPLRMLMELHGETHPVWRITPIYGGAWNYEKVLEASN